jgi:hypothetical protein
MYRLNIIFILLSLLLLPESYGTTNELKLLYKQPHPAGGLIEVWIGAEGGSDLILWHNPNAKTPIDLFTGTIESVIGPISNARQWSNVPPKRKYVHVEGALPEGMMIVNTEGNSIAFVDGIKYELPFQYDGNARVTIARDAFSNSHPGVHVLKFAENNKDDPHAGKTFLLRQSDGGALLYDNRVFSDDMHSLSSMAKAVESERVMDLDAWEVSGKLSKGNLPWEPKRYQNVSRQKVFIDLMKHLNLAPNAPAHSINYQYKVYRASLLKQLDDANTETKRLGSITQILMELEDSYRYVLQREPPALAESELASYAGRTLHDSLNPNLRAYPTFLPKEINAKERARSISYMYKMRFDPAHERFIDKQGNVFKEMGDYLVWESGPGEMRVHVKFPAGTTLEESNAILNDIRQNAFAAQKMCEPLWARLRGKR